MKKLLAIAISAAALSAMAETVTGSNEIGTLEITSTHKKTVVAVPFNTLGADATSIKPSDLILTTNLTAGDQLYVYQNGAYKGWVLDNSEWEAVDSAMASSDGTPTLNPPDVNTTVPLGSGFWLVRNSSYVEGTPFTFYIYGQYAANVTSTITANAYNLIANPKSTAVTFKFAGAKGDYLIVPNGEKPKRYEYDGSKWYTKGSNAGPVVQPGQGFWYVSAGGGSGSYAW